jgi:hypothetical protein
MTPCPYPPEDTYLVDQIPPVHRGNEVIQVLSTEVENSDVNDNQQETVLPLLSHYSDFLSMGSQLYLKIHSWNIKLNCMMIRL